MLTKYTRVRLHHVTAVWNGTSEIREVVYTCTIVNTNRTYTPIKGSQFDVLIWTRRHILRWFIVDYAESRGIRLGSASGLTKPFCILTSNPGNIGHGWYMQLFGLEEIKNWIRGVWSEPQNFMNPNDRISEMFFIPAFIPDNKIGVQRDPEYEKSL